MSNMAVQMNYGEPSRGMPGLLYDRANYDAVTRRNSAEDGKLFFGCGARQGHHPSCNRRDRREVRGRCDVQRQYGDGR